MKNKRFYYAILITILIILPILIIVNVIAQDADYIEFREDNIYIWNVKYDEDLDKDMGYDLGTNTTYFSWDEDYKSIKIVITWIGE